ncbi:Crp/Fnr family transcriptional regulator [Aquabacterium sp. A08]|uniref:Crp/Fnr family transcriptional regulator n=1 Tax=Aquabacterium sp. A08 TaxID=2718532 RepID=UPI00142264DC|nr:Crp/Fnr family transcriptional regulator [Aquabacterium sp. A08]NIC43328.1 Crp/Fnr family transcriptional regulator [Aquabacterium sp. A08]
MLLDKRSPASIFLYGQPWFDRLPEAERHALLDTVVLHKAAKGEHLLRKGDRIGGWYGVLSGMAKLQTSGPDGKVSAFLGVPAGEWFGEGSVLRGDHWRYDVVALRDTTLIGLPLAQFQALYRHNLAFNHYLIERLNLRLGQAMAIIESGRLRSPEERVAQYLSHLFWQGMRKINLSQEDLGHLAGLSRQTINRVLKQFEAQGWVSLEFGRVDILNDAALEALLRAEPDAAPLPPP